jgi:large subunit ribosomal protein L5
MAEMEPDKQQEQPAAADPAAKPEKPAKAPKAPRAPKAPKAEVAAPAGEAAKEPKAEKPEKADKAAKADPGEKADKAEKGAKGDKADKAAKGKAAAKRAKEGAGIVLATAEDLAAPAPPARLYLKYQNEIVPALRQKLGLKNNLAVPRLEKIVVSMGLGKAVTSGEKIKMDQAEKELSVIVGQKPLRCKAKKSVANFKVRQGMETGLKVTLRGRRMYEFLDRTISLAFPRVKDFRGLDPDGFDQAGNYNFGFTEQTVYPEVNVAEVTFQQGMNITVVTTARNAAQGRELLRAFGMPFRETSKQSG